MTKAMAPAAAKPMTGERAASPIVAAAQPRNTTPLGACALGLALAASLALHLAAFWPGWRELLGAGASTVAAQEPQAERVTRVGKERAHQPAAVAWVSYEDFQRIIAPSFRQDQPAVQNRAEPTPDAPVRVKPTGPEASEAPARAHASADSQALALATTPTANPAITPPLAQAIASPAAPDSAATAQPRPATTPAQPPPPTPAPTLTPAAHASTPAALKPIAPAGPPPAPSAQPAPQSAPQPAPATRPAAPAAGPQDPQPKPTSAPRSDFESPPTSRLALTRAVVVGGTVVDEGLEVKTALPEISVIGQFVLPRNPTVRVTFSPEGRVLDARFVSSTGTDTWDSPVLASLYRWRATGERLTRSRRLELEVKLVLLRDAQ